MTNAGFLRKRIGELDARLDELIEDSACRLGLSPADLELALEDLDTVPMPAKPRLDPQAYDPTGEMRRTYAERQLLDRKLTELQDEAAK